MHACGTSSAHRKHRNERGAEPGGLTGGLEEGQLGCLLSRHGRGLQAVAMVRARNECRETRPGEPPSSSRERHCPATKLVPRALCAYAPFPQPLLTPLTPRAKPRLTRCANTRPVRTCQGISGSRRTHPPYISCLPPFGPSRRCPPPKPQHDPRSRALSTLRRSRPGVASLPPLEQVPMSSSGRPPSHPRGAARRAPASHPFHGCAISDSCAALCQAWWEALCRHLPGRARWAASPWCATRRAQGTPARRRR